MCGIAGFLSNKQDLNHEIARRKLNAMQNALNHRGPDGCGDFFCSSGYAAFCHTRLAIIDLSSSASQPMTIESGRYTITFNGEIYNYQKLREHLKQKNILLNTQSDTEVLLHLYALYGADCVHKIRGMFAFVIWDQQTKTAFAARDPFGIKPFYFRNEQQGHFSFASEIRSLLSASEEQVSISGAGLYSYFRTGTVSEPNSMVDGINMLPAGHTLTWKDGSIESAAYWKIGFQSEKLDLPKSIELTRNALESSIEAHLVSDVPVGIFLSGGIDSTTLVALATQMSSSKINTYSIAFESEHWNEGDIAKRIAEHFGTNHTEFLMTPAKAEPLFDEFLATVDQPTIDGFNTFCVSKLASNAGEKVVLSGLGGDELFAGYYSFTVLPKMLRWHQRFKYLSPLARGLNRILDASLPPKVKRILDFAGERATISSAHASLRGIFSKSEAKQLTALYQTSQNSSMPAAVSGSTHSVKDQVSEVELSIYMRNQLLRDSDVMSMACGLELRVPFVDKILFESIARIPAEYRLQQGKKLLIDAMPELPEWVINRPKQGFRFPFDEWFSTHWKDMPQGVSTNGLKLTPWYRRWNLLILDDWLNRYLNDADSRNGGKVR